MKFNRDAPPAGGRYRIKISKIPRAQRHNGHVRQSYRTEFPKFRMRSEGDGLMEWYIGRKKQRNQAGQKREAEWSGFLFGVVPNLLPSLRSFTTEARDFRIHGTQFANIIFLLLFLRVYRFYYPLLCGNWSNYLLQTQTNLESLCKAIQINPKILIFFVLIKIPFRRSVTIFITLH